MKTVVAPGAVVSGYLTLVELPVIEGWSKAGGRSLIRRWSGQPSEVVNFAAALKASGVDYSIQRDPGNHIVSATYATDENQPADVPLSDNWEMDEPNDIQLDIWEHPTIVAEIAKAQTDEVKMYAAAQAIRDIKAIVRGEIVTTESGTVITLANALTALATVGMNRTVMAAFVKELQKGLTTYTIEQYVLRRVRVVHEATAIAAAGDDNKIGWIFSLANLRNVEGAPVKIPGFGTLPEGHWLKRKPSAIPNSPGPGKWTITNTYWHADSWSLLTHPNQLI